ncbi:MAG: hypothetical protein ACK4RK_11055 [Gemmataceae bacterium]
MKTSRQVAARAALGIVWTLACLAAQPATAPPAQEPSAPRAAGEMELLPKLPADVLREFQKLLDERDRLRALLEAVSKPRVPNECRLTGRVVGDVVRVQATFHIVTEEARELIALGCHKARPIAARFDDGQLPILLPPGDDGFLVRLEKKDHPYTVILDMEVPVFVRDQQRGFELSLPRAAVTLLEAFDGPDAVQDVRIKFREREQLDAKFREREQVETAVSLRARNPQRRALALGPTDRLEISWRGPTPQQPDQPLVDSQGEIDVLVEENQITTTARLTLKTLRGQTDVWKIYAPTQAIVELPNQQYATVVPPTDAKNPVWTVQLTEPGSGPLTVHIRQRQMRNGQRLAVGPYFVLNAFRQQGRILIKAPADVRVRVTPRGEIIPMPVPEAQRPESGTSVMYHYFNLPNVVRAAPPPPLVELDVEKLQGVLQSRLVHHLQLTSEGWLIRTDIHITPVRMIVDRLEVEVPNNLRQIRAEPATLVESVELLEPEKGAARALIKLAQAQGGPFVSPEKAEFRVTLHGLVAMADDVQDAILLLPQPRNTLDQGGEFHIHLPEGWEMSHVAWEPRMPLTNTGQGAWRFDQAPTHVDLGWRQHRLDLSVDTSMDVSLNLEAAQAHVRCRFRFPRERLRQLRVHMPGLARERLPIVQGGVLVPQADLIGILELDDAAFQKREVTLEYWFDLPAADSRVAQRDFVVPLFWCADATQTLTQVRVWSDPGVKPVLASRVWEIRPPEIVPGRDRLPSLVMRATGTDLPLVIALTESALAPLAAIAVDRVLVQVFVRENGEQEYRTRFLINKLTTRTLDLELPTRGGTISSLNLDLRLDGHIPNMEPLDDHVPPNDRGHLVRLRMPQPESHQYPMVLDVYYVITPGIGAANSGGLLSRMSFWTSFQPPQLRGNVFLGRVRWQVELPGNWVAFEQGRGTTVEQQWGLRGWLPAPRASASHDDLERWFSGSTAGNPNRPSLVCWQTTLQPLSIMHVPQQVWLLLCSLVVLTVGLLLYYAPLSRAQFWCILAVLGLTGITLGVWWPSFLPLIVYGSQPGILILALVLGIQWMLQQRYRRQLIFMPGFSRVRSGSSVTRGSSKVRIRGEPSTVDAVPPPAGAS